MGQERRLVGAVGHRIEVPLDTLHVVALVVQGGAERRLGDGRGVRSVRCGHGSIRAVSRGRQSNSNLRRTLRILLGRASDGHAGAESSCWGGSVSARCCTGSSRRRRSRYWSFTGNRVSKTALLECGVVQAGLRFRVACCRSRGRAELARCRAPATVPSLGHLERFRS